MKLIFERSKKNRGLDLLPECDVEEYNICSEYLRKDRLNLPEVSENDISRHYTELADETYGVNNGFYPLGSCTMKYNPKINEDMARLEAFESIHPLQSESSVQGCLEVLYTAKERLCEITGMDDMTFQPAAGAHGEFTGLMLIKKYHEQRGDFKRKKIIIPDSAHGTNPASAVMAGFEVVNIPSNSEGGVDIDALKAAADDTAAGLMLTNPNTLGLFDKNITQITDIIHKCGGLNYYDGANLNAVMGIVRPGDIGFDCMHINLHKTFSTPHGGGGPGAGPVGCKTFLADFLPDKNVKKQAERYVFAENENSIGSVRSFYGNFLVVVRALTYILTLGKEGIPKASRSAVLNANYMMASLKDIYDMPYKQTCMHEFVMSLEDLKKKTGICAMDIAKGLLDYKIHPPTMYFPLIVHEALMLEPTETESKETMDYAVNALRELYRTALENPERLHSSPQNTPIGRPDELNAARKPILRYISEVTT